MNIILKKIPIIGAIPPLNYRCHLVPSVNVAKPNENLCLMYIRRMVAVLFTQDETFVMLPWIIDMFDISWNDLFDS